MFLPRDPVGAPGSYPTEMFTVTKPRRQPKRASRVLRGQENRLESAHQYSWGKEPQPESCQDYGHSGEAAATQGKGPVGLVQGYRGGFWGPKSRVKPQLCHFLAGWPRARQEALQTFIFLICKNQSSLGALLGMHKTMFGVLWRENGT